MVLFEIFTEFFVDVGVWTGCFSLFSHREPLTSADRVSPFQIPASGMMIGQKTDMKSKKVQVELTLTLYFFSQICACPLSNLKLLILSLIREFIQISLMIKLLYDDIHQI